MSSAKREIEKQIASVPEPTMTDQLAEAMEKEDSPPSPQGEQQLEFVIGHKSDHVTIHFNFPVKMVGLSPAAAISLAEALIDHAGAAIEEKCQKVENSLSKT